MEGFGFDRAEELADALMECLQSCRDGLSLAERSSLQARIELVLSVLQRRQGPSSSAAAAAPSSAGASVGQREIIILDTSEDDDDSGHDANSSAAAGSSAASSAAYASSLRRPKRSRGEEDDNDGHGSGNERPARGGAAAASSSAMIELDDDKSDLANAAAASPAASAASLDGPRRKVRKVAAASPPASRGRASARLARGVSSSSAAAAAAAPAASSSAAAGEEEDEIVALYDESEEIIISSASSAGQLSLIKRACSVCGCNLVVGASSSSSSSSSSLLSSSSASIPTYVVSSSCGHLTCRSCTQAHVKKHITLKKLKQGTLCCPAQATAASSSSSSSAAQQPCYGSLTQDAASRLLDAYWSDRLEEAALEAFLEGNPDMFKCPNESCGNWMEKMAPQAPKKAAASSSSSSAAASHELDAEGKPLSAAAVAHRDQHRLRCRECSENFCAQCSAMPYHLGRTCEQQSAHALAVKCRFCEEELPQGGSDEPAADEAAAASALSMVATAGAGKPQRGKGRVSAAQKRAAEAAARAAAAEAVARASSSSSAAAAGSSAARRTHGLKDVCRKPECVERALACCPRTLPCGHACCGVYAESVSPGRGCLPCLKAECVAASGAAGGSASGEDYCNICFVEGLAAAPCLRMACGHTFHEACVKQKVSAGCPSARITFFFLDCPLCKAPMDHWSLRPLLDPLLALKRDIEAMAAQRLKHEGLEKDPLIASRFNGDATAYAVDRFAYYTCYTCKKPFFGGMRQCGDAAAANAAAAGGAPGAGAGLGAEAKDLICPGCQPIPPGVQVCEKHGKDYLAYKCRYCCTQATWFCWGSTRFCNPCHDHQVKGTGWWLKLPKIAPACGGAATCPLRTAHPPNGEEYSLGCEQCRSEKVMGF